MMILKMLAPIFKTETYAVWVVQQTDLLPYPLPNHIVVPDNLHPKRHQQWVNSRKLLSQAFHAMTGQSIMPKINTMVTGKPYWEESNWHFNLSHTDQWIALVVANYEVGIDIETVNRFRNFNALARKMYHPQHVVLLNQQTDKNRQLYFYQHWCALEAWFKYLGHGIAPQRTRQIYLQPCQRSPDIQLYIQREYVVAMAGIKACLHNCHYYQIINKFTDTN